MIKRVLICRSNPISPDPRVEKIARALVAGGYRVQLLGWDQTGQLPLHGELDDIPFQRCRVPLKRVKGLWNFWFELRWQAALLSWLVRNRKTFDIIHACDFDTVLPALICKYIFSKKLIYDIFDFYADMLRFTPKMIKAIIRRVDLRVINRVDAVILADDSRKEQISGSKPRQLAIIYNSPEDQYTLLDADVSPHPDTRSLHIVYVGNLQIERGLLELADVMGKHLDWKLDLAGYGSDEARIQSAVAKLPNVIWHGKIPFQRAMELISMADVIVATYSPQIPNHRFSSPNKLFEAMMLGKPVIAARGSNIDRIVVKENCGMVIDYGDVEALESSLAFLQHHPTSRQEYGHRARKAYENTYNWSIMQNRLMALYQGLVD